MDSRLSSLISEYLGAVAAAAILIEQSGFILPTRNMEWACNGMPHTGLLHGEISYRKHGYGCAVYLKTGVVDFDFGPLGEISGFDAWRLIEFSKDRLTSFGFKDPKEIEKSVKAAISAGEITHFGQNFYRINEKSS